MEKTRRGSAYFVNNFVHVRLPTLEPIRAALTSQEISFDTKFSPSQSRVTLPLNISYTQQDLQNCHLDYNICFQRKYPINGLQNSHREYYFVSALSTQQK